VPLDLNNLDDAEKFQKHFVTPLIEAVREELKPLTKTTYSNRARIDKLERKWGRALWGFSAAAGFLSVVIGLLVDTFKKRMGL
jgi:hypothetical protein